MAVTTGRPRPIARQYGEDWLGDIQTVSISIEDLGAGSDIADRGVFAAPYPLQILEAKIVPWAASAGVDGSNTLVVDLKNLTATETIGTVTSTTNLAAATPVDLTLTSAHTDVAANAVLGVSVTQGATANTAGLFVQFSYRVRPVNT